MTPRGTRVFIDDFREIAGGGGFGGSFFDRFFFDFFCLNNYKNKISKKHSPLVVHQSALV